MLRSQGTDVAQSAWMHAEVGPWSPSVRVDLLADHGMLETVLGNLMAALEANDGEQIQCIWTDFESRLSMHLAAEEKFLIPALLRARERDARTLLAEHKHLRTRLGELGAEIDLHTVRLQAASAFVEELRAHARHEDGLYTWADAHLSESDRTSLLTSIARAVRTAVAGKRWSGDSGG